MDLCCFCFGVSCRTNLWFMEADEGFLMSIVHIYKKKCDRCGIISNDKTFGHDHNTTVRSFTGPIAFERKEWINWQDLCGACNEQVTEALERLVITHG